MNKSFSDRVYTRLSCRIPKMSKHGFNKAVYQTIPCEWGEDVEELKNAGRKFVPDGYVIDEAKRTVYLIEIEDTSPVTVEKLKLIGWFGFAVDCLGWHSELTVYDRWGNVNANIDCMDIYLDGL